jgi:hypothetical protein
MNHNFHDTFGFVPRHNGGTGINSAIECSLGKSGPPSHYVDIRNKEMTLLGTAMQVVFSVALTLAPAAVLKKNQMRITTGLSFIAILATSHIGGLVFAIPITIILLLFSLWVRFVGRANVGPKRVLFIVTIVLSALFLAQHLAHLPIRIFLDQPAAKIEANVGGIFLAVAMLSATLEMMILKKTIHQETRNQS